MTNRSRLLAGLSVLIVCAVSSTGQTGYCPSNPAVSGANRPPGVPEEYGITPFGYFHPSCVRHIGEGKALLADGRVQHSDGSVEAAPPACYYARYSPQGTLLASDSKVTNGWVEKISATTSTSYGKLTATWTTPQLPATNHGQTLFFFPGFEDTNDTISILQPVLQYGVSCAGGGNYWAIASWNCCISNNSYVSPLVNVSPGDSISGSITSTCKQGATSCPTWNVVTKDNKTGGTTTLPLTPSEGQVWNWAFGGVLEVYNVVRCSDYPARNQGVAFKVQLYDDNLKLISYPNWIPSWATGVTPFCGFGVNSTATSQTVAYNLESVLHGFGAQSGDGANPYEGLILDQAGNLYGTTMNGGTYGYGTVFKTTSTGQESLLHSFSNTQGDGAYPLGGLLMDAAGNLYGTTTSGGPFGMGIVFAVTSTGQESTLYTFQTTLNDGAIPYAPLIMDTAGNLYGTTNDDGFPYVGAAFKLDSTGRESALYVFGSQSGDGAHPTAGLIMDTAGYLYSTTINGGAYDLGTVFRLTPAFQESVLYSFGAQSADAMHPEWGSLIFDTAGNLYGTTAAGGAYGWGAVFKLTSAGQESVLYSFLGPPDDGGDPFAGLITDKAGNLYGTTAYGGAYGYGAVFKISTTGKESVLYNFANDSGDGANPYGGLILDEAGNLYGTTLNGGTYGYGTVFKVKAHPTVAR
jgi:uncharacterized repeat protein (TIGR03803 family)